MCNKHEHGAHLHHLNVRSRRVGEGDIAELKTTLDLGIAAVWCNAAIVVDARCSIDELKDFARCANSPKAKNINLC